MLPLAFHAPPTLLQVHGPSIRPSLLYWPLDRYLPVSFSISLCPSLSPSVSLILHLPAHITELGPVSVSLGFYLGKAGGRAQLPPSLPCPGSAAPSLDSPGGGQHMEVMHLRAVHSLRGNAGPRKGPASRWSQQPIFLGLPCPPRRLVLPSLHLLAPGMVGVLSNHTRLEEELLLRSVVVIQLKKHCALWLCAPPLSGGTGD